MSQPTPSDVLHSLDLVQQVISEAVSKLTKTKRCDGDCSNCPCSQSKTEDPQPSQDDAEN